MPLPCWFGLVTAAKGGGFFLSKTEMQGSKGEGGLRTCLSVVGEFSIAK